MSLFDGKVEALQLTPSPLRTAPVRPDLPLRTARFEDEPGFYEPAGLWLYGNIRLIRCDLGYVREAGFRVDHLPSELDAIERRAEEIVLGGQVLVCGVHNPAHQRAAVVPLRWGAPRILVVSGGFHHHLGPELTEEPFRAARLWRYQWDPHCDLIVSRRAPDKRPTYGQYNPTVDRLIVKLCEHRVPGPLFLEPAAIP